MYETQGKATRRTGDGVGDAEQVCNRIMEINLDPGE